MKESTTSAVVVPEGDACGFCGHPPHKGRTCGGEDSRHRDGCLCRNYIPARLFGFEENDRFDGDTTCNKCFRALGDHRVSDYACPKHKGASRTSPATLRMERDNMLVAIFEIDRLCQEAESAGGEALIRVDQVRDALRGVLRDDYIAPPKVEHLARLRKMVYEEPVPVPSGIEKLGDSVIGAFNLGVDITIAAVRDAMGWEAPE